MTTMQLPGIVTIDSQMSMHTTINNTYIILARVFQRNLSHPKFAHGLIDHVKERKQASNCNWAKH